MSARARTFHRSGWQGVFYVTGGGSGFLAELLTTPGASKSVLEARVPYAGAALADLLQAEPEQACSERTARALAMAAFQRAGALGAARPFGLGCTASLATDRAKRGAHRAFVALQTDTLTYGAELAFDADRTQEEAELVELIWHALTVSLEVALPATADVAPAAHRIVRARDPWAAVLRGDHRALATAAHDGRLLFPGAFNPLHHAHQLMLTIAEQKTGLAGAYELSIVNVDKPWLDFVEIDARLPQFDRPVWLTRLPTFLEKARHFPGARFVVGSDTMARIADAKYYAGPAARDAALEELASLGCGFIVFGRTTGKRFVGLADLSLPPAVRDLCLEIPRAEFHEPVSSSELRRKG